MFLLELLYLYLISGAVLYALGWLCCFLSEKKKRIIKKSEHQYFAYTVILFIFIVSFVRTKKKMTLPLLNFIVFLAGCYNNVNCDSAWGNTHRSGHRTLKVNVLHHFSIAISPLIQWHLSVMRLKSLYLTYSRMGNNIRGTDMEKKRGKESAYIFSEITGSYKL